MPGLRALRLPQGQQLREAHGPELRSLRTATRLARKGETHLLKPLAESFTQETHEHGQTSTRSTRQKQALQQTPGAYLSRLIPERFEPAAISFLTVILLAWVYRRYFMYVPELDPEKSRDAEVSFRYWRHDLFGCFEEPALCITACGLPCISLADSTTKVGLASFWITVVVSSLLCAANLLVVFLPWCIFALYCMWHRQHLRSLFEMEDKGGRTIWSDCLLYLCLWPCTLTQDARQVKDACETGHPSVVRPRRLPWD